MGTISWMHMIVVAVVTLVPFTAAVAAFVLLLRLAGDVRQIRKLLEGGGEKP